MISPPSLNKHKMAPRGTVHLSPVVDRTFFEWNILCVEVVLAYHSHPKCEGQAADKGVMAPWYDLWLFGVGEH